MTRKIQVCLAPDVDSVAAEIGVPRLLKVFAKFGITTTWFIPGHSLDSFPKEMAAIRDAGHEIGLHGYSHENPTSMTLEQQKDVLSKTYKQLTEFTGKPIVGSVAPWWETSKEAVELLLEYGIEYDHSAMAHDSQCYYLRDQDSWTPIDYKKQAESWMKPLVKGKETGLVEIPANWYLDDLPPMMFIKKASNSHGWVSPHVVEELWKDHFLWLYENEEGDFCMPITLHPDVSGRPQVLMMLERFITFLQGYKEVEFVTMHEISNTFRAKQGPPVDGAVMPKGFSP